MRSFFILFILLGSFSTGAFCAWQKVYEGQKGAIVAADKSLVPPILDDTTYKAIRDLQVEQDRYLIQRQSLELEYERKKKEFDTKIDELRQKIDDTAYQFSLKEHIDSSKYVLDLFTLTWKKREEKKP